MNGLPPTPTGGSAFPISDQTLVSIQADLDQLQLDESNEPAGLRQQVHFLLDEWLNICIQGATSDKTYAQYLSALQSQGVLNSEESTRRFFRIMVELCLEAAFASAQLPAPAQNGGGDSPIAFTNHAIDALGKLIVFLVKVGCLWQYCTVLCCTVLDCTVLDCTVLYCTVCDVRVPGLIFVYVCGLQFMEVPQPSQQSSPNANIASKVHMLSTFLTVASQVRLHR